MAEQWVCVFNGRAGGHARAVFVTKEQATQFAERHARAFTPSNRPLKWEVVKDSIVLTTQVGDYLVAPMIRDETSGTAC